MRKMTVVMVLKCKLGDTCESTAPEKSLAGATNADNT